MCEFDFGPLEVVYDYEKIRKSMTKAALLSLQQQHPLVLGLVVPRIRSRGVPA